MRNGNIQYLNTLIGKQETKDMIGLDRDYIHTSDEFRKCHNFLLGKYDITFMNNCDYWSQVSGNIYYKGDEFICHITGIFYNDNGDWGGDFDGYLKLLEESLYEKYEF